MAGLLQPTGGTALIDGIDVTQDPVAAKRRVGYIPDHPFLYEKLTGWEFLHFIGGLFSMSAKEVTTHGEELLSTFDMLTVAHQLVGNYSHGMRQRLAFAACFLHRPKVVVVDEPWVGLDPRNIRAAIDYMKGQVKLGVTIFMSTHSLNIAEETAERIGILHNGRLIYDGSVAGLRGESVKDLEEIFLELTA
jgi:ABC-2 type transport system ATP-binding protein